MNAKETIDFLLETDLYVKGANALLIGEQEADEKTIHIAPINPHQRYEAGFDTKRHDAKYRTRDAVTIEGIGSLLQVGNDYEQANIFLHRSESTFPDLDKAYVVQVSNVVPQQVTKKT